MNYEFTFISILQLHIRYYICKQFLDAVEGLVASEGVKNVLLGLCRLYLIHNVILNQGHFLRVSHALLGTRGSRGVQMSRLFAVVFHVIIKIKPVYSFSKLTLFLTNHFISHLSQSFLSKAILCISCGLIVTLMASLHPSLFYFPL